MTVTILSFENGYGTGTSTFQIVESGVFMIFKLNICVKEIIIPNNFRKYFTVTFRPADSHKLGILLFISLFLLYFYKLNLY